MAQHTFTASIHKEDDLYVATCVEIGTISQGDSVETALANLKEATSLYLEEFPVAIGSSVFLTTFTTEAHA
jgi:predicted RNase H-like HicB family nuclease